MLVRFLLVLGMTPLYKSKQVQIYGDKSQKCLNTREILFRLRPQWIVLKRG